MVDESDDKQLWQKFTAGAGESPRSPCPDENALSAYLAGRCEGEQLQALETHLWACQACRRTLSEVSAILALPNPAPAEVVRLATKAAKPPRAAALPVSPAQRRFQLAAGWAAMLMGTVLGSWLGFSIGYQSHLGSQPQPALLTILPLAQAPAIPEQSRGDR